MLTEAARQEILEQSWVPVRSATRERQKVKGKSGSSVLDLVVVLWWDVSERARKRRASVDSRQGGVTVVRAREEEGDVGAMREWAQACEKENCEKASCQYGRLRG